MAKKKKKPPTQPAKPKPPGYVFGRPTSYQPDKYPGMLVEHMKKGQALHTFGCICSPPVAESTLYVWLDAHSDFLEAKKIGELLAEKFWTDLLAAGASGQLKRLAEQEPVLDHDKNPVIDPSTGKPMMKQKFEPATFNATATIFALKNKFPRNWRDRKEIDLGNRKGAGPLRVSSLDPKEAKGFLKKLGSILTEAAQDEAPENEREEEDDAEG